MSEIDTSPEYIAKVIAAAPFADNEAGIPQMVELIQALAARLAEAEAERDRAFSSIRWVDEVYPDRVEAGGAGIEITWDEFNAMQRTIGVTLDKRIGGIEGKARHNHRLRVACKSALARAEAAEAELSRMRTMVAEARNAGREEAARAIRAEAQVSPYHNGMTEIYQRGLSDGFEAAAQIVDDIRALKEQPE